MRLAHVTTVDLTLWFLLREQMLAYRKAGFEVVGISAPGPWAADLAREGVPHVAVPALRRRWDPAADARALLALIRAFRRLRPDVVHTHTPKAGVLGRVAARLAGVGVIVNTTHGFYVPEGRSLRRSFFLGLERVAARCSHFEFCQSREDLETLRRLGVVAAHRSAYLGNGVNLQRFDPRRVDRSQVRAALGIPEGTVVVGTVGRLVWEKGYRELFALAEALRREGPGTLVLAVGPEEADKADAVPPAVVADLQRRGLVRFLGLRADMPELYAAMDIFLLPSYREGFPRSAVEAAAMGLPVILTDIRGCREVVAEGENGFLVPPRDAPTMLERVRRLVHDGALRARFGQESRRRAVAEFDERRVIAQSLELYRRLLGATSGVTDGLHQESTARG